MKKRTKRKENDIYEKETWFVWSYRGLYPGDMYRWTVADLDSYPVLEKQLRRFSMSNLEDYISERLTQLSDNVINESLRTKFRSIATEVKNVIPMAMIKMKGEEK